ncbi:DsbA family oxidoreductase [Actinophytocola sediminis]
MVVDVWSDIVCPWCYIGKRRFEAALAEFPHRGEVGVRWRSFELDPNAPSVGDLPVPERLQRDHGLSAEQVEQMFAQVTELAAAEGLDYRLAEARQVNSFHLHRLLHLAAEREVGDAVLEALMHAQHCAVADLSDRETLLSVTEPAGLSPATVTDLLDGDDYADEVRADEDLARRLGVTGVPAFVFADRYLVSGAQSVEVFTAALNRAWQEAA